MLNFHNIYWPEDQIKTSLSLGSFAALLIEPYKDVFEGRPQDVGKTRSLELNIRPYGDILITSAEGILKTSIGNVSWRYL